MPASFGATSVNVVCSPAIHMSPHSVFLLAAECMLRRAVQCQKAVLVRRTRDKTGVQSRRLWRGIIGKLRLVSLLGASKGKAMDSAEFHAAVSTSDHMGRSEVDMVVWTGVPRRATVGPSRDCTSMSSPLSGQNSSTKSHEL